MSELYNLGLGYWPDELDENGELSTDGCEERYEPWERWRLQLFGGEAGDVLEEKSEVDKILKSLGYKMVKDDEWIKNSKPKLNGWYLVKQGNYKWVREYKNGEWINIKSEKYGLISEWHVLP